MAAGSSQLRLKIYPSSLVYSRVYTRTFKISQIINKLKALVSLLRKVHPVRECRDDTDFYVIHVRLDVRCDHNLLEQEAAGAPLEADCLHLHE